MSDPETPPVEKEHPAVAKWKQVALTALTPEQIAKYAPEVDPNAPASAFGKALVPAEPEATPAALLKRVASAKATALPGGLNAPVAISGAHDPFAKLLAMAKEALAKKPGPVVEEKLKAVIK